MSFHVGGEDGKHSKKETLIVVGTFALVILAAIGLKKGLSGNTTSSSLPAASFTPSDYGGTSGGTGTGADVSELSDTFAKLLQGVSDQAQENQALVQSQISGLNDQTAGLDAQEATLANLIASLGSKVEQFAEAKYTASPIVPPTILVADPKPISGPPSTGNPVTSYEVYKTFEVKAGDSWNTIAKATGKTVDQLRTLNAPSGSGGLKALEKGSTIQVRTQ